MTERIIGKNISQLAVAEEIASDAALPLFQNGVEAKIDYTKFKDAVNSNLKTSVKANTDALGGHTLGIDVPKDAKFTDTVYVQPAGMIIAQNVIKEIGDLEV